MNKNNKILKVGIVGCGTIAQIMYLPILRELEELYKVVALCDVSKKLVQKMGELYNVKQIYTDYHKMLKETDMDAVIILTPINHSEVAIEAALKGIHILTEKPMSISLKEADEMLIAAKENRVKLMVAHMRLYNPAYEAAREIIKGIKDKRFIRLHTSCGITGGAPEFLNQVARIYRFDDIPDKVKEEQNIFIDKHLKELTGLSEAARNLYINILGGAIHDIYVLRGIFGNPEKVLFTERWNDWLISVLDYGEGLRCSYTMGGTPDVSDFEAGLTVYGRDKVVNLRFQPSYIKNAPAEIEVREMDKGMFVRKTIRASWEEAFKRELMHFHECVIRNMRPITHGEVARQDLKLLIDICRAYKE